MNQTDVLLKEGQEEISMKMFHGIEKIDVRKESTYRKIRIGHNVDCRKQVKAVSVHKWHKGKYEEALYMVQIYDSGNPRGLPKRYLPIKRDELLIKISRPLPEDKRERITVFWYVHPLIIIGE